MKTSQVLMSTIALLIATSQMACSAKIEGGSGEGPSSLFPGQQSAGFDIASMDGNWKTGCVVEDYGFAMSSTLNVSSGNFEATTKVYKYNRCEETELMDSQTSKGRVVAGAESSSEAGSYQIDLEIPQGNNVTVIEHDLVRFENGKLYLGDHQEAYNGFYPSKVDKKKPYTK